MLSIDSRIFEEGSVVEGRMLEYADLVEELHIVIYTKPSFDNKKIGKNLFIYPTNTKMRPVYYFDAFRIVKSIFSDRKKRKSFIIDSQEAMTNMFGLLIKLLYRVPLHIQIHTDFGSPFFKKQSFINFLRYVGYQLGILFADAIRVVSERIKHEILASFHRHRRVPKISVLPIAIDKEEFLKRTSDFDLHKQYLQFKFIALMVSRLEPEKDIMTALQALRFVVKELPGVGLVIAGEGSERKNLEGYVQKYGLENNVVFVGWRDDVASFYRSADAYLLTSRFEGYARTLVEAAAAGCPIITTDVGIAGYVFLPEQSALVAPVGDGGAIARHLYRLATNSSLRLNLAAEAHRAQVGHGFKTREAYLAAYKKSWESCGL